MIYPDPNFAVCEDIARAFHAQARGFKTYIPIGTYIYI